MYPALILNRDHVAVLMAALETFLVRGSLATPLTLEDEVALTLYDGCLYALGLSQAHAVNGHLAVDAVGEAIELLDLLLAG